MNEPRAGNPAPPEPGGERTLIFRLGRERFGLLLSIVREVFQPAAPPVPVPGAPGWLCGILNHHGNVIPVIRMDELLSVEADDSLQQIILVQFGGELVALQVGQIESLDEVRAEGPAVQGRRRAWHRGTLLAQLDPQVLAGTIQERLMDPGSL